MPHTILSSSTITQGHLIVDVATQARPKKASLYLGAVFITEREEGHS
jgi:hypothetical protein